MKSLVIYYSHAGGTAYVAYKLLNAISKKGEADIFELTYHKGKRGIFLQFLDRVMPFWVNLSDVPLDVKDYGLICVGTPVWGGRPCPPVQKYLQKCYNIEGKKVIYFQVYGVELSGRRCVKYIKNILNKKGCTDIIDISIPWAQVRSEEFIDKIINERVAGTT